MPSSNQIIIKRRVHGGLLLFAWIVLILLPGILFQFSFSELLKFTKNFNYKQIKPQMMLEMDLFKKDIDLENYLTRKLTGIGKEFKASKKNYSPENIKEFLQAKIGIKPSLVITHGKDTKILKFWSSKVFHKEVGPMPKTLTKQFLMGINKQPFHDFFSKKLKRKYKRLTSKNAWNKFLKKTNMFFQKKLTLISEVQLASDHAVKSISGKLGGPVFLFYECIKKENRVEAGFFIAIKGVDLPAEKAAAESLEAENQMLKRDIVLAPKNVLLRLKNNLDKVSSFSSDVGGINLHSTIPQSVLSHYIQAGGIYPKNLKVVEENLPLLKVSCSKKELEHPLSQWADFILKLSKLLIIIGGVFFLRTYFYGFDFNLGIQFKLMIGLFMVSLVPFSMLVTSYIAYQDFGKKYFVSEVEQEINRNVDLLQKSFANFLSNKQVVALNLSEFIAEQGNKTEAETIKLIENWTKSASSAVDVVIGFANGRFHQINKPEVFEKYPIDNDEKSLRRVTAASIINFCFDDGKVNYGKAVSGFVGQAFNGEFLSKVLDGNGELYDFPRFKTGSMYSTVKLIEKKSRKFIGILSIRFHKDLLMNEFLKANKAKLSSKKSIFNFLLTYDYFKLKFSNGISEIEKFSNSKKLIEPGLKNKIFLAKQNNQAIGWNITKSGEERIELVKFFPKFPLIIHALAKSRAKAGLVSYPIFGLLGYLFFMLLVLYKFLGEIYLKPVKEFVRVSNEVENGNYQVSTDIQSGDEFQELKTAFKSMIRGLSQKEKLAKFVSDDVMEIVQAESDAGLHPGGEKVEASILFIEIENFERMARENTAEETIALLDKFIESGSRLAAENNGVLDKVIEGTLMLVFREKKELNELSHALRAAKTALDLQSFLKSEKILARVGIASGTVVSGRIGSRKGKLDYTVIGDTVNLAARLKGNAKKATTSGIVLAPSTIRKLRGKARVQFIERVSIKGKTRDFSIYELLALR